MPRILVVDDSPQIRALLDAGLTDAGLSVTTASGGEAAMEAFLAVHPNAVLLDVVMPGMDGYEICRRLRLVSDLPIIMVTVLDSESEVVRGFEAGADDYVVKPFRLAELAARLAAIPVT